MKFSRLSLLALIPALMLFVSTSASAQAPEGQLGIQAGTLGLGIQYAISPSLHVGTTANILLADGDRIALLPYVKFLLEGEVNPYFKAGLQIGGDGVNTVLFGSFGLEYFPNENVGLFGEADFVRVDTDAETNLVGIISGHAGIEYFFD